MLLKTSHSTQSDGTDHVTPPLTGHFVSFWSVEVSSGRLEASHLDSTRDIGLADEAKHIRCPCHLRYRADPSASLLGS
jgi:hypothetical protein